MSDHPPLDDPLSALRPTGGDEFSRGQLPPPAFVRRRGERQRRNQRLAVATLMASVLVGSVAFVRLTGDTATIETAGPSTSATRTGPTTATSPSSGFIRTDPGWALDRIDQRGPDLDNRYITTSQGDGVTVYLIDGRIDPANPEFEGRASVGLSQGAACRPNDAGVDEGTFIAGIVAGRRTGVAPNAKVVSVGEALWCDGRAQGSSEAASAARAARGLTWISEHARKPAVVNMSASFQTDHPDLRAAVQRLIAAGIPVVAAAGDGGQDACGSYPAAYLSVISVSASNQADAPEPLSQGRCVNLFAPGAAITSVDAAGLRTFEGSSSGWAAPYVSGAVALYLARHPDATIPEVREWLLSSATTDAFHGDLNGSPNRLLYVGGDL